jgi:hypothetical protein
MSAKGKGKAREGVRIFVADGPDPGWWIVRPAMAVRRADAPPEEPYLLAFDDRDLELLVGRDAPLQLKRRSAEDRPDYARGAAVIPARRRAS